MAGERVNWKPVPSTPKDEKDKYLPPAGLSGFYVTNVSGNKDIERCVMPDCKKETPYLMSTPIQQRRNYIDGAGQLCENCYHLTYGGENGG